MIRTTEGTFRAEARDWADPDCRICGGSGELQGNDLTRYLSQWCRCAAKNRDNKATFNLDLEAP